MAKPKRAKPTPYDPYGPWTLTPSQMQHQAHTQSWHNTSSQLAALPSLAYLQNQQKLEGSGIANITSANVRGLQANNDAYAKAAAGIAGAYGQGFNQAAAGGNAALAALGQAPQQAQAGGLLASMGANNLAALQGAPNAAQGAGALYAKQSLAHYADALTNRQQAASKIVAGRQGLEDQYLNALKQEALQRAAAKSNADIANAEFGLKSQSAQDLAKYRAGLLQNASDRNAITAANADARLKQQADQFNASLQAKYDLAGAAAGAAATKTRQSFIKDLTAKALAWKSQMTTTTAGGGGKPQFVFQFRELVKPAVPAHTDPHNMDVTIPAQPAQYHTFTQAFQGANLGEAQGLAQRYAAMNYANKSVDVNYKSTIAASGSGSKKVRVFNDHILVDNVARILMSNGYQRATAIKIARNMLGIKGGGGSTPAPPPHTSDGQRPNGPQS